MAAPKIAQSAIYAIRNTLNGRVYIGSSIDLRRRWNTHLRDLRRGSHCNQRLQRSWLKYGEGAFSFEIVETVAIDVILDREQHWLDLANASEAGTYNMCRKAGNILGIKRSAETRAKMSASTTGYRHTEEAKAKMSALQKGKKRGPRNPEVGKKISAALKGRPGKPRSAEATAKIIAALTGRKRTPEEIAKATVGITAAWQRKREKAGIEGGVGSPTGFKWTDEQRAALKASHARRREEAEPPLPMFD